MTLYKIVKSVLDVCRKKKSDYTTVNGKIIKLKQSCTSKREIKIDIVAIILSLIVVVVVFLIGHLIIQQVSKELNANKNITQIYGGSNVIFSIIAMIIVTTILGILFFASRSFGNRED